MGAERHGVGFDISSLPANAGQIPRSHGDSPFGSNSRSRSGDRSQSVTARTSVWACSNAVASSDSRRRCGSDRRSRTGQCRRSVEPPALTPPASWSARRSPSSTPPYAARRRPGIPQAHRRGSSDDVPSSTHARRHAGATAVAVHPNARTSRPSRGSPATSTGPEHLGPEQVRAYPVFPMFTFGASDLRATLTPVPPRTPRCCAPPG